MDTSDSYRSSVPARLPMTRPGAQALRPTVGSQATTAASPISIRVVIRGARRYWWLVLALWMVGSGAIGASIYLTVKPTYRASSLLQVDPSLTDLYNIHGAADSLVEPFLQTQVQLITSPNVLTSAGNNPKAAVLERIQKAGDVVLELRKAVNVSVIPGTFLIEVSMNSTINTEAAILVNVVVDSFMDANREWSDGMNRTQIKNLESYREELKGQTDELERKWKAFAAKGNFDVVSTGDRKSDESSSKSVPAPDRASITVEEFKQVRKELLNLKLDLGQAESWLETAKLAASKASKAVGNTDESTVVDQQIDRMFRADVEVIALANQMMQARNKVEEVKRIAVQPGDPAERAAVRRLQSLKTQYEQLWEVKSLAFRSKIESGDGRVKDPMVEIREASAAVAKLRAKQTTLKADSDKLELINRTQSTDAVEVELIQDERATLKAMLEKVLLRLEQLKFEAKGNTRIRPVSLSGAIIPTRPVSNKRVTYLAATPVGVLGVVLGLIVLLEIRSGRVDDPEVLSSRMKHEVFAIAPLPNLRPGDDSNSEKSEQRLARFVQSLDHLRVAICEAGQPGEGRCVMITSATGGEGKTTLSAHLAARCANSGTRILLVDADMRRASLGRLLDIPPGPGLADVLGGEIDLDEVLITMQAGGFHFLSAGTPGRDPSRVLRSNHFSELLARLRLNYDLILIDTPPILPVADALIMGRWVDGAVMAARSDASRLPLVERANRQLALAGIPVLGVVVNGVRGHQTNYGNYAYSYNYGNGSTRAEVSSSDEPAIS